MKWIPTSERLPENGHYYLWCSDMGHVQSDYYWDGFEEGQKYGYNIVAWMPLPKPYTADRKTENSSEKPNNCEHITEDGVTCAKYPACDDCLDNPLNKVKGSERLVKGKDEPTISILEQVEDEFKQFDREDLILLIECQKERIAELLAKDEPQLTPNYCGTCKHREVPCGDLPCDVCHSYSNYEPQDEPQTDCAWK